MRAQEVPRTGDVWASADPNISPSRVRKNRVSRVVDGRVFWLSSNGRFEMSATVETFVRNRRLIERDGKAVA